MEKNDKLETLTSLLREMKSVAVAYSGGVDSALLLKLAHDTLGDRAVGLTAVSPSLPASELAEAREIAGLIGARHVLVESHETEDANYLANPSNRCFFCKSEVYDRLFGYCQENGYAWLIDGTNADDRGDHRPGRQAARERGVRSPLMETGFTKAEIRLLARQLGLPIWDKPAAACLSSRIPYGSIISLQKLSQVERAELFLRQLGFRQVRVRHHDQIARIEVDPDQFAALILQRESVLDEMKNLGFTYITLDLAGFRSGSMNEALVAHGRG